LGYGKLGLGFWLNCDLDMDLPLVRIKTDQTKDDLMIVQSAFIRCACCNYVHSLLLSVCDNLINDPKEYYISPMGKFFLRNLDQIGLNAHIEREAKTCVPMSGVGKTVLRKGDYPWT
jgi:hypothetical protein